jgi:hypothetical protein
VGRVRLSLILFLMLGAAAVLAPGSARPGTTATQLNGSVGPGFVITLKDANGNGVTHLDPGDYTITVQNMTDPTTGVFHNFHLKGPGGVNLATTEQPGTTTWNVTLVDGTYTYLCDFHPLQMKKTFTAGNAPPPPPPTRKKLKAKVGPRSTITLKTAGGALVRTAKAGKYSIAVSDATTKDNFHLLGPGVSKKTSVRGRASATWKITLRKGKYSYFSDAHRKLRRTFRVT